MIYRSYAIRAALCGTAILCGSLSFAALASSANYELTYANAGASGEPSQSATYATTGIIRTAGASVSASTSAQYSIQPLAGTSAAPAKISDWQLF